MRSKRRIRAREAVFWLVLSRLLITFWPFRRIAAGLGTQGSESALEVTAETTEHASNVRRAVNYACRKLHWRPSCLVRSLAAMVMLRRAGVEGTLYLGVARKPGELHAHAWVRCGKVYVVGGRERAGFTVLSCFTRTSRS
jgi:hypothetical protein